MSTTIGGALSTTGQGPRRMLRWTARVLMLAWVAFWVWFSLASGISEWMETKDVRPFWSHQLLALVLVGLAWLSWRREVLGGVLFAALPMVMLAVYGHNWPADMPVILLLEAPALLIGLLLVLSWNAHRQS